MNWKKKIVYVKEDPEEMNWYVLLVGPNLWLRAARFKTRAGAESYRPAEGPLWLGEPAANACAGQAAATLY